jgi:UDP-N-acetyl-D-glucosamine dehydrogenase
MIDRTVTVVGLGKIGLPLAVQISRMGANVIGVDINENVIQNINNGIVPFPGEHLLQEYLIEAIASKKLKASLDITSSVSVSDVVLVIVPVMTNELGDINYQSIDSATRQIAKGIKNGTLISYETTLPVGTTRNRFSKILSEFSGMKSGEDFYVVFSPERVLTGRVFEDLKKYPKLVGGINDISEKSGIDFYSQILEFDRRDNLEKPNGVWGMGSSEAAEFAKLIETTYRDVNIALANEFALFAEKNNLDIYKVIEASNSQPYSNIHLPGIAVGGHCIPVYPQFYLLNNPEAEIVRVSRKFNSQMPKVAVKRFSDEFGDLTEKSILVLGLSYRSGVKEIAFSGFFEIKKELERRGAKVLVYDSLYSSEEIESLGLNPLKSKDEISGIIVQNNDAEFYKLSENDFPNAQFVYDGRRVMNIENWKGKKVKVLGVGEL